MKANMGNRGGIWLIAAAAAIPGLLLSAVSPVLDHGHRVSPPPAGAAEQVATPAKAGVVMPVGPLSGSSLPGRCCVLQPIAIAGLVAALVSGLLAAGAARTVMRRNAVARNARARGAGGGTV